MHKLNATDKAMRELRSDAPNFGVISHVATDFSIQYVKALNWVHYNVDDAELKAELIQCLQDRKADALVPYVTDLDGVTFSTLGKIAYCVNRGADLAPKSIMRIRNALERVRDAQVPQAQVEQPDFEYQAQTVAGRVNEIYKACYSRMDNIRARVLAGKITLENIQDEVRGVLDANGAKAQVRKRLVEHYTQSLQEALADKTIKMWVKPLQEIVRVLGGDVKEVREKVRKVAAKAKAQKVTKTTKQKAGKGSKPVANKTDIKTITIKPKREEGKPTIASQVRDLIRMHKTSTDEQGMVQIVIRELGLSRERGRSVVKVFWSKVEAA